MRNGILIVTALMLALGVMVFGADDPFNGTWRVLPSNTGDAQQPGLMELTPGPDGISIKEAGEKPTIVKYRQETSYDGLTINITRIDDHNCASTFLIGGKIIGKGTATDSADRQHCVRNPEAVEGTSCKSSIEYNRVGPVLAGNAFFGTWQQNVPKPSKPDHWLTR